MPSPLSLARICGRLEGYGPALAPTYGAGASAAYVDPESGTVVFRGTVDLTGWLYDFSAINDTVYGLGAVEAGFYAALTGVLPELLSLEPPKVVAGHSLGAAMAVLYAGVLAVRGLACDCYAFEPPRPAASPTLGGVLRKARTRWLATRNGHDLVPYVPPWFELPGPLTPIGTASHPYPNFDDHHIWNVIKALEAAPDLEAKPL